MNWYKKALKSTKTKWTDIKSVFIKNIAYNKNTKQLKVRLKDNNIYTYKNVPERVFVEFKKAKSKGTFFNEIIKPKYQIDTKK